MKMLKRYSALLLAVLITALSLPVAALENEILPEVKSVEFEKISIIEGMGSYQKTEYNPDAGLWVNYYHYNYSKPEYIVTLKDGTILKPDKWGWITYKGDDYCLYCSDDQSYTKQWGVGTHTVAASIMGFETSFEVEITESPYVSLEILEVEALTENENCYISENGNIIYYNPKVIFKITDKDGKSVLISSLDNFYVGFSNNQEYEPWTVGGKNRFTLKYLNLSGEASVELKASSPFKYIEQNDGLYITDYCVIGQEKLEIPSEIDGKPVVGILSLGRADFLSSLKSVTIPDSVKVIGDSAFSCADSLEAVTIGSGVKNLDAEMFCLEKLSSITVSKNNPYYCDDGGIVYNKQKTALVVYPLAKGESYTVPASVTDIDILNSDRYAFLNITFADESKMFVTVDGVTYNSDKTKVITCDTTKSGYYVMPDTVTEISENAFSGCTKLTGVKISENVTSIVYRAFECCSSLSEIALPSKLVSIDERAFAGCSQLGTLSLPSSLKVIGGAAFASSGLKSIDLPDSVEELGYGAFYNCRNLVNVKLSNKLTYLDYKTFSFCESLTDIIIPHSVKGIGVECFAESGLTAISIPDSVTYLGSNAFSACEKLENATFGKGLTEISYAAFSGCGIKELYLPENIISVGSCAFSGCKNLTDVQFTNSSIEIGVSAFSNCPIKELKLPEGIKNSGGDLAFAGTSISKLSLPNSVTRIAYRNFANCSNLSEIDIPSSVISMGGYAFDETPWYDKQADGAIYIKHILYGFKGVMPANSEMTVKTGTTVIADCALEEQKGLTSIALPEGLKTIGSWAFYRCTSIKKIDIPATVTEIDPSAFAACSSLTAINVSDDNPNYKSVDGVLFNKDGTELLWCPKRASDRYEVPSGVKRIATGAFSDSGVYAVKIMNPDTELSEYSVGFSSLGIGSHSDTYFSESFGRPGGAFKYNVVEIICPENSKAYAYAKSNSMLATVPEEIKIETSDTGINISGTSDIISGNTEITVEEKKTDKIVIAEAESDKYNLETAVVFDINLKKNGIKVQPNGAVTVSIPVPETLNGAKCRVFYIDENGKMIDMKAIYRNGRLIFETDHFSNYMIAESYFTPGELDGSDGITDADAVYLLMHTYFPEEYPVQQPCDFNGDGAVTDADAVYLLMNTYFPEDYPLN